MIRAFLARRREFRASVQREASDLVTFLSEYAYPEARHRMWEARARRDRSGNKLWSKVAVEIAGQHGHQSHGADPRTRLDRPTQLDPKRREISDRLVQIARGLGDLSAGQGDATTLHYVSVAARQLHRFAGRTPALVLAAEQMIGACRELLPEYTRGGIRRAIDPATLEEAKRLLHRLRMLALAAR